MSSRLVTKSCPESRPKSRPGLPRRRGDGLRSLRGLYGPRALHAVRGFGTDTRGSVMAYMGIMLPVMLGITGLALDGSLWYAQKRNLQAIADTAAYSVMLEVQRIGDTDLAVAAAREDAAMNGLNESAGDSLTFHIPPTSGAYAGMAGYYEAVIEQPAAIFLAGLFVDDFDTAARAVSGGSAGSPPPCLLASDPSMSSAFKVNNGSVKTTGCDIQVNSSDDGAVDVAKNGALDADPINIVGDYINKGTITSEPNTGASSLSDPLASLPTPAVPGCDYTDVSYSSGSQTLSPGVYCGGISLSGDAQVTMEPGNYIISGDSSTTLSVAGQASVTGSGVTTYFDGDTSLSVNGQGALNLTSPSSGTYAGILFYGDPNSDPDTQHMVTGNGSAIFDGIMYFPNAIAKINGNGNTTANTSISAVMARQLRFGGNGTLNFHIAEDAILPPALQSKLTLVE